MMCLANVQKMSIAGKVNKLDSDPTIGQEKAMGNRYRICREDGVSEEVFYGIEQTDWCARCAKQCCPDCAPWKISLMYTQSGAQTPAFKMQREFTCACCCFNRPVVEFKDAVTGQTLGSIRDPFACCDTKFLIRDPSGHDILRAKPGMGQCGLCCPLPCCTQLDFSIRDADSGTEIGQIQKKLSGCCKCKGESHVYDSYLTFDGVQHPQYKALLMGLCVFMDYRYFNEKRKQKVIDVPPDDGRNDGGIDDKDSGKDDSPHDKDRGGENG